MQFTQEHTFNYRLVEGIAFTALVVAIGAFLYGMSVQQKVAPISAPEKKVFTLTPKDQLKIEDGQWAFAPNVPPAPDRKEQRKVVVRWETKEVVKNITPDTQYEFWTFEGSTPGPVLRIRQGDVVEVHLKNNIESKHPHNVDFHFSTGPGGGAKATTVLPGEEAVIEVRAMTPGFYMYHCATPDIPTHTANGMYGYVIVDPEDGLPQVDHEYYVVQSEIYTEGRAQGIEKFSMERGDRENPEFVVFNGAVGAMTGDKSPKVKVGDSVRIFFGDAGPNLISSFHVIGEIFDRVYREGDFITPPGQGIGSTLVPAGGGTVADFTVDVPGTYILVDHSLFRAMHKGAMGTIIAEGPDAPEIFEVKKSTTVPVTGGQIMGEKKKSDAVIVVDILPGSGMYDTDPLNDYSPKEITVSVGDTITWTNKDDMPHTVTAYDGSFDSKLFKGGESWSHTFTKPGRYEYYCSPHPWMKGTVIVK